MTLLVSLLNIFFNTQLNSLTRALPFSKRLVYIEISQFIQSEFPKIEFNAGHDLNLENLNYFLRSITNIKEVSIGHALICDTFEFGLEKTIKKYLEITSRL